MDLLRWRRLWEGFTWEELDALKIIARQVDGSVRTANRCSKYRFYLEQKAGRIYGSLEDETYHGGVKQLNVTQTTKQQAEEETGKDRKTLNRWIRESEINKEIAEECEAICDAEGQDKARKITAVPL